MECTYITRWYTIPAVSNITTYPYINIWRLHQSSCLFDCVCVDSRRHSQQVICYTHTNSTSVSFSLSRPSYWTYLQQSVEVYVQYDECLISNVHNTEKTYLWYWKDIYKTKDAPLLLVKGQSMCSENKQQYKKQEILKNWRMLISNASTWIWEVRYECRRNYKLNIPALFS